MFSIVIICCQFWKIELGVALTTTIQIGIFGEQKILCYYSD